jgi:hypothetical protein
VPLRNDCSAVLTNDIYLCSVLILIITDKTHPFNIPIESFLVYIFYNLYDRSYQRICQLPCSHESYFPMLIN